MLYLKIFTVLKNLCINHQFTQMRYGKENREFVERSADPSPEVHHIPRRPEGNFSLYDGEADQSQLSHRDDVSEADSERRMMKRKVLR